MMHSAPEENHRGVLKPKRGLSIQAITFDEGHTAVYGFKKAGPNSSECLAARLCDALYRLSPNMCTKKPGTLPFLTRDFLGCPRLYLKGEIGLYVSFSHVDKQTWAALSMEYAVGIDVAVSKDFQGDYPFSRVFRNVEFVHARCLGGHTTAEAGARLWSIKEAAVKALGCGFHLIDPLDLKIGEPTPWNGGHLYPAFFGRHLGVWSRKVGDAWLAIAHTKALP